MFKKTVSLLFLTSSVFAAPVTCGKGSFEYRGECVVDIPPITAEAVLPSDEVPPKDKMPSWQREGITVIEAPNLADADAKADAEIRAANMEGKRAAGIK